LTTQPIGTIGPEKGAVLSWQLQARGGAFSHTVTIDRNISPEDFRVLGLRLCGHLIVGNIAERGLRETVECLAEMFEHYAASNPQLQSAPAVKILDAPIAATYKRPDFQAED
jgi:hypothetical protein